MADDWQMTDSNICKPKVVYVLLQESLQSEMKMNGRGSRSLTGGRQLAAVLYPASAWSETLKP